MKIRSVESLLGTYLEPITKEEKAQCFQPRSTKSFGWVSEALWTVRAAINVLKKSSQVLDIKWLIRTFLKMGHSRPLFLFFFISMYNRENFFANAEIWSKELWCWKGPLYQLSHTHCPWLMQTSSQNGSQMRKKCESLIFKLTKCQVGGLCWFLAPGEIRGGWR